MLEFLNGIIEMVSDKIAFFSNAIDTVSSGLHSLFCGAAIMPALFGVLPSAYTGVLIGIVAAGLFVSLFIALMRRG